MTDKPNYQQLDDPSIIDDIRKRRAAGQGLRKISSLYGVTPTQLEYFCTRHDIKPLDREAQARQVVDLMRKGVRKKMR